jgi:molecular chaperone DnaK (HSP70)
MDYAWGFDISLDADPVRWFKLLLLKPEDMDPETKDSEFLIRARKMMRENGKTAVDFVADYLRAFWKHVVDSITRARGESVVEALTFHVVVTVPAIWKGYARQAMNDAVTQAGILDWRPAGSTTLTFAPEPEAAALATLFEQGEGVKKGNVYIICDAGGGTVVSLARKPDRLWANIDQGPHFLQNQ